MKPSEMRHFILDMDGTVYLGDRLLPGAARFIEKIRATGRTCLFLTNNSSKSRFEYVKKLTAMGIDAQPDDIFTSGEATVLYIQEQKPEASVLLLGTPELEDEFVRGGLRLCRDRLAPDFVVLGFDTTLTYDKIRTACDRIRDGVPFIATHPDITCPVSGGWSMPDTGSMIRMFEAVTGVSPTVVGKPNRCIIDAVMQKFGYDHSRTAMVGDRLYTDIAVGKNAGIGSVLVFSGETSRENYQKQTDHIADLCFDSVADMIDLL